MNPFDLFFRRSIVLFTMMIVLGLVGCRNPAQSSLPPSAISPPGTPVPILAQGDVYADETDLPPETIIQSGDLLEVMIRRGSGEEQLTTRVSKTGWARVSFFGYQSAGVNRLTSVGTNSDGSGAVYAKPFRPSQDQTGQTQTETHIRIRGRREAGYVSYEPRHDGHGGSGGSSQL